jgi:putative endonuclease
MPKVFNRETGRKAEAAAGLYLEKLGYRVIMRNFSTRYGEIDLICEDNSITVFVEVKAKKGLKYGTPEEMFTRYKYERVKRMATVYLKGKEVPCRIDMVAVDLDEKNQVVAIRHYPGVSW